MGNRGPVLGRRVSASLVVCVALFGSVPPARADCSRGTRPPTVAEKNFQLNTLKAIKAAMPAAADGWRVVEETEVRPPRLACIGQERLPLGVEYRVRFAPDGDASSEIAVVVNARHQPLPTPVEPLTLPDMPLSFRAFEGAKVSVLLFAGDWSIGSDDDDGHPEGEATAHFLSDLPYTQAQSVAIRIAGDRGRVDALVARLNLSALGALIHQ